MPDLTPLERELLEACKELRARLDWRWEQHPEAAERNCQHNTALRAADKAIARAEQPTPTDTALGGAERGR
jgi:hypothetical protein